MIKRRYVVRANPNFVQPWKVIDTADGSIVGTYPSRQQARTGAMLLNRSLQHEDGAQLTAA